MKTYLFVYFGAAFTVQLATPFVARLARSFNITDKPDARRVHKGAIPRIGGVAIMLGVVIAAIPALLFDSAVSEAFSELRTQLTVLLGASLFVFLIGLLDDIRSVSAPIKLLSLIAASLVLCSTGARIETVSLDTTLEISMGWLSWPVTVLWIVGITVAMNFIDGLDGLASGIAAIVAGVIAVLAFSTGQVVMGVLMLALLGSLTGFLFFNFNPAKIFMGDCGSLFLGFAIGAGSVVCQAKTATLVGIALPALALGVPLFDAILTMVRRKVLDRRSIFAAERGHIHHRLLDMGLHQRVVVILMCAVSLAAAGIGLLMFVTRGSGTVAVLACGVLLLLLVFRLAGAFRLRDILDALHRNSTIAQTAKTEISHFEDVQLQMRRAVTFDQWWRAACCMAERMEFERLALVHCTDGETADTYVWRRSEKPLRPEDVTNVVMPLGDDTPAGSFRVELSVRRKVALESVGRRVALFGRLIDEHNPSTVCAPAKGHNRPERGPNEPPTAGHRADRGLHSPTQADKPK